MISFSKYSEHVTLMEIEFVYGSLGNFLEESAKNVVNRHRYNAAIELARQKHNEVVEGATNTISNHLQNYGRSLNDEHDLTHLHDDLALHRERDEHLKHLKNLYDTNRDAYNKEISDAKSRLPKVEPYGQNAKTATMTRERVAGKDVAVSVSNKGVAGSVAKIGKGGAVKMQSTCVNSKQACRGEGKYNIGATCLGRVGCYAYTKGRISNTVLENLKTLKAPATNGAGHDYTHNDNNGNPVNRRVAASPHLDYAALEYDSLINATSKAKKLSEGGNTKLVSFRQNTQNEQSAMHHDQVVHHLPEHLKPHIATNNYSATVAKAAYDPENPSHASTHDGVLNNTNFSVKGPDVVHNDRGRVIGKNASTNLDDATKALNPEVDNKGKIVRAPQNAYAVAGGHSGESSTPKGTKPVGVRLRYPDNKDKVFNINAAPKFYAPFQKLGKIKTARIHTEVPAENAGPDYHHPDGHGRVTYQDHTGKKRVFEYQDYHVHANVPHPDSNGTVDFHRLNDNVGSDDRKPKGSEIRRNKNGHVVGSIHISASTASTPNINADGVHKTNRKGEVVGDDHGLANDPFVFPIQHHIDKEDETRINLNHPHQIFAAEAAEKQKRSVQVDFPSHEEHPKTKGELGQL